MFYNAFLPGLPPSSELLQKVIEMNLRKCTDLRHRNNVCDLQCFPCRFVSSGELQQLLTRQPLVPRVMLVDGYNVINYCEKLKSLASISLEAARDDLVDRVGEYAAYEDMLAVVVFDAEGNTRGKTTR